jgi:hypothetical protein
MAAPELDDLFRDLLASNRGPGYDISVTAVAPDFSVIEVSLRFLEGQTYCCAESGCHLPRSYEQLVRIAAERSIPIPSDVLVRWHCYVEQGARLESHQAFGLPLESIAYEFEAAYGGGDSSRREPEAP